MINRRVRLTLEFDVSVKEKIDSIFQGESMTAAEQDELKAHEQALLDAMIADPDALNEWIKSSVVSELQSIDSDVQQALAVDADAESRLLSEKVKTLSAEHREF